MSQPAVKQPRADELEPVIRMLAQCTEDRFSGSVEVHFNNGVPTVVHRNEVHRLKGTNLTVRGT